MKIFADTKNESFTFEMLENGESPVLKDNKNKYNYYLQAVGNNRYFFKLDGKSYLVQMQRKGEIYNITIDGEYFEFRVEDERMRTLRELANKASQSSGEQLISAPIPGLITGIKISVGDKVSVGDGLLTLEAMKMENEIKSNFSGMVKKIFIEQGAAVEKDQKLLIVEI
jgi:biotin carboxyl carrier protein